MYFVICLSALFAQGVAEAAHSGLCSSRAGSRGQLKDDGVAAEVVVVVGVDVVVVVVVIVVVAVAVEPCGSC
jgi:hypothetical protein